MLSEVQTVKMGGKYTPLAAPITMRIRFRKIGNLQYISHLDLQRTLQRILVRADVPVWYTKGFNPHMKLIFSTPLSIGAESICEMVDIRLDGDISCDEMVSKLNEQVTDELKILGAYLPTTKFSDIAWSEYEIAVRSSLLSENHIALIHDALHRESLEVTKKTKSGEKTVNVIPLIRNCFCSFDNDDNELRIKTMLRADGENYLNPELFLLALNDVTGILAGEENNLQYSILRIENYFEDGKTAFR